MPLKHIDLVGSSQWTKKSLVQLTIEKVSGKYDWTFIYYHHNCEAIQMILKNDDHGFEQDKKDMLKTSETTYTVGENMNYQVSKSYTLVLKPHLFVYKNKNNSDFDPLRYEIEGIIVSDALAYYELVEIIKT